MNKEETIEQLGKDTVEIDLSVYIYLLWRKKWLIIGMMIITAVSSYFYSKSLPEIYQSTTTVMIKEDNKNTLFDDLFYSSFSGKASKVSAYLEIMKTRTVLDRVIKDLDLRDEDGEMMKAKNLKDLISITGSTETNIMTVSAEYSDPALARDIANKLVNVFIEQNQENNRSDLANVTKYINQQLIEIRENLNGLEDSILSYKNENGAIFLEEYGRNILDKLIELDTSRARAKMEYDEIQLVLQETRKQLLNQDKEIVSSRVYTEEYRQLEMTDKNLDKITKQDNPSGEIVSRTESVNPFYQDLAEKILNMETTTTALQARIKGYKQQIVGLEQELNSLPAKELELARLFREESVAENIYKTLVQRNEEIQIQTEMQSSDILIVDTAYIAEEPIKPGTKINVIIAALLAFIIVVFIIFMREYLDKNIKEKEDIEQLTGLAVLGVIPDMSMIRHDQSHGVDQ